MIQSYTMISKYMSNWSIGIRYKTTSIIMILRPDFYAFSIRFISVWINQNLPLPLSLLSFRMIIMSFH